ncbi:hypothetical protein [Spiroplasma endosymbiont of Amphibalanus improvisus]|uniref:hypothetical protein n=1 Tax=Spiroplasma endosymbiont of Amphibalanus improvisus TaxID=3066327 RepID=UPI00313D6EFC
MKGKINNLCGIKNKLEIELLDKNIIFTPNGDGKISISKGFENLSRNWKVNNLEGEDMSKSIIF